MTRLGDVCEYRNESIAAEAATSMPLYISTDSMMPNRGPIFSSTLPNTGKVKRFQAGDTLVSNIRPYFKKIWRADAEGACSNDVLVFTPTKCLPDYLHWILSSDDFFSFVTKTSKGTKMPRGDKRAIMNYSVQVPSETEQHTICAIMDSLQKKITINGQLNDYLLELATVRFEQELVKESKTYRFSELIELEDSKRVPLNSRDRKVRKGSYPYYGATSIMDYVDDYLFDGIRVLLGEDGTVIREDGKPVLQYVWGKYWVNNHAHILKSKADYSLEAIYIALARTTINHIVTGAVQMKISQKNLNDLELEMPTASSLDYLEDIFALYRSKAEESKKLGILRDALLPKLMSGEIDVSKVDLTQLTNNHLSGCGSFCSVCCPSGLASEFHEWFREHFFFSYGHLCKADLG